MLLDRTSCDKINYGATYEIVRRVITVAQLPTSPNHDLSYVKDGEDHSWYELRVHGHEVALVIVNLTTCEVSAIKFDGDQISRALLLNGTAQYGLFSYSTGPNPEDVQVVEHINPETVRWIVAQQLVEIVTFLHVVSERRWREAVRCSDVDELII